MSVSGKAAIAGVGTSRLGKLPGETAWTLQLEAVRNALEDAGIDKSQIDGLFTESQFSEPLLFHGHLLGRMLGLRPDCLSTEAGVGSTACMTIQHAAMAIDAGLCEVALCVYGDNARTGLPNIFGLAQMGRGQADEIAYGLLGGPVMEALSAMRYLHEFGATYEMLGSVAITFREHARLNPNAQFRDPLSMEQYLASPFIAEPLRRYDCVPNTDGAAAVIVTRADRARDLAKSPIYLTGMGQAYHLDGLKDRKHYTHFAGARSSERAYEMAQLGPSEVDTAQFYDCFTSTVLITIEDYGFCKKGEGGYFAKEGNLGLGGELPSNTDGGMLSGANLFGWGQVVEATRQLRGECGERQVPDAKVAVVAGHGGFQAAHATLILTNEVR